ncbi:MocR-like pyridoxine biosynthesis transcription factor PdxR [Spirosoma endophyticum]|uniref:GntR family transcriptional regulator / MocR family aminotransferase n=1 Tax=Spirosoma endophyticum TaxID=662367 RepID=A0A1I2DWE8_9BACT|nr:PLP-dependent aminotransferase family protein [Spirosoma endophyticum]SFE84768.1 GntR family transcriptional regulator / MocR family aminotransferase [Spirosoma endophyticum]
MGQLRPWVLNLSLNWEGKQPVYLQVADYLRDEIRRGRLAPGSTLPGSRRVADQLSVNRKTVVMAYEQLLAEGWIVSRDKSGTFVSDQLPQPPVLFPMPEPAAAIQAPFQRPPDLPDPTPSVGLAPSIVFTYGVPDVRLAPLDQLAQAHRRIFNQKARWRLMGYGSEQGDERLRQALTTMLALHRGIRITADQILITRGSQMALYLTAMTLLQPGDVILVENPGYAPAWEAFRQAGARLIPVRVDEAGLVVEQVQAICQRERVKALLVTPQHQFPTTVTLKADRRLALLALSAQYGFTLIEDDYDHDFHYGLKSPLPLASYETAQPIVYIGSLSKLIAPAVRIGFMVGPPSLIRSVAQLRAIIDRQGDVVLEQAVAGLMETGEIQKHARRALSIYRQRHRVMADLLHHYLADRVIIRPPEGGLAYWIPFHQPVDFGLVRQHLASQGVSLIDTNRFSFEGQPLNALRLGFASLTEPEMEQGIRALKLTLDRQ